MGADRGIVCIDEFDKMTDQDRTAIHEVMEQGRVTISKAGIHARLNARCCVLAAANPVWGRYDMYKSPMENIGLQDSLLSRFDCLFIMLDQIEVDKDRKIADHVVRMHRYRGPNEQDGDVLAIDGDADILTTKDLDTNEEEDDTPIWEKYDALLHGNSRKKTDKIVSVAFMKKYIHIAKCIKPVLTHEACEVITEEYTKLRVNDLESDMAKTAPVTARCLETLIRLATAHAKARLSKVVEVQDAQLAIELVQYAYFKKVETRKGKRARSDDESGEEEEEDSPRKRARRDGDEEEVAMDETEKSLLTVPDPAPSIDINEERYKHFMRLLNKCFSEKNQAQELEMPVVRAFFKKEEKKNPFSDVEVDACIDKMADENKVMLADQTLFMI